MDEKRGEIVNIERFFSGECDARKAEVCFLQNLRSILKIVLTSQLFFIELLPLHLPKIQCETHRTLR